jgi:transcriptional accessory protein Tex/SPT6
MVGASPNSEMREADKKKIAEFMQAHRPDVIVLGASQLKCRVLKKQLEDLVAQLYTRNKLDRDINVLYADQSVAYKYAHSQRAATEFPRYSASRLIAVSLARRCVYVYICMCVIVSDIVHAHDHDA